MMARLWRGLLRPGVPVLALVLAGCVTDSEFERLPGYEYREDVLRDTKHAGNCELARGSWAEVCGWPPFWERD